LSRQQKALIDSFTTGLFDYIFFGDIFHSTLQNFTSDVFLACIIYDTERYRETIMKLVNKQEEFKGILSLAFSGLEVNVVPALETAAKQQFQQNFNSFLKYRNYLKK